MCVYINLCQSKNPCFEVVLVYSTLLPLTWLPIFEILCPVIASFWDALVPQTFFPNHNNYKKKQL